MAQQESLAGVGNYSGFDGLAGIRRQRQGQRGVVELGFAWGGPAMSRKREVQLEGREPVSSRVRRDAHQFRTGRSADGLQKHLIFPVRLQL